MGLKVKDVVVLIDREQGGKARLASMTAPARRPPSLAFLKTLEREGKMTKDLVDTVKAFIAANQTGPNASGNEMVPRSPPSSGTPTRPLSQNQCAKDLWASRSCHEPVPVRGRGHQRRACAADQLGPRRYAQDALRPLPRL